ncbi:hypothetical protein PUN28_014816 [Cardiocondyla obscurior]|uniref:Uncharacterized protein n=1 Tax=Cardiocondyla obscurior TaxID=286306 RepID=A0AAW2EXV3_9HYME
MNREIAFVIIAINHARVFPRPSGKQVIAIIDNDRNRWGLARIVKSKRTTKTGGASITVSINEPPTRDPGILERYMERLGFLTTASPSHVFFCTSSAESAR